MNLEASDTLFPPDKDDEASVKITMGETALTLTHANTTVYTYRRHPDANHVFHRWWDGEDKQTCLFGCEALIETLRQKNFREVIDPRPSPYDERLYMEYQKALMEEQLGGVVD